MLKFKHSQNQKNAEAIIPMAKSFNKYQLEVRAQNLNVKASDIKNHDDSHIYPVISSPLKVPDKQDKKSDDNKKDK